MKGQIYISLENFNEDELISVKIINTHEKSYNKDIIYNILTKKIIFFFKNSSNEFPIRYLEIKNEIEKRIYNIDIFDIILKDFDLYLYSESDFDIPKNLNLLIDFLFIFRIREESKDDSVNVNMTISELREKEIYIRSFQTNKYSNKTREFHCNIEQNITEVALEYIDKINADVPYTLIIINIKADYFDDTIMYNITSWNENNFYLNNPTLHLYYNTTIKISKYKGISVKLITTIIICFAIVVIALIIIILSKDQKTKWPKSTK